MFTKQDWESYCLQVLEIEQKMDAVYSNLAANLSHAGYRKLFDGMHREEELHMVAVRTLMEFLAR